MSDTRDEQVLLLNQIRDAVLGSGFSPSNSVKQGLKLALSCQHDEARLLVKIFEGREGFDFKDMVAVKDVFLAQGDNNAIALCYASQMMGADSDIFLLKRSAELGFGYACALMAWRSSGTKRFEWAQKSVAKDELLGYVWLDDSDDPSLIGSCFSEGEGCDKDVERAKQLYFCAVSRGYTGAILHYSQMLDKTDPQRYYWLGQLGAQGEDISAIVHEIVNAVQDPLCFSRDNRRAVFAIGRMLNGKVDFEAKVLFGMRNEEVFGKRREDEEVAFGLIERALLFYKSQLKCCRLAVDAWSGVGLRNGVVKDVRKLIAGLIWDERDNALFGNIGLE